MEARTALAPLRRVAASASLAASSVGFAWVGAREHLFPSLTWAVLGMASLTGAASLALLRRAVLPQVLARGVAWVVLLPSVAAMAESLLSGRAPDLGATAFAASAGLALQLSRSNLTTDQARREFHPVAYRRSFLWGATAAATGGIVAALGAAGALVWSSGREGLGLAALAAVLLATVVGVVRMRAWGVLLGAATSLVLLVVAALTGNEVSAMGYLLASLPGLMLAAPIISARLRPVEAASAPAVSARAAMPTSGWDETTSRVRVAAAADEEEEQEQDPEPVGRARLSASQG